MKLSAKLSANNFYRDGNHAEVRDYLEHLFSYARDSLPNAAALVVAAGIIGRLADAPGDITLDQALDYDFSSDVDRLEKAIDELEQEVLQAEADAKNGKAKLVGWQIRLARMKTHHHNARIDEIRKSRS